MSQYDDQSNKLVHGPATRASIIPSMGANAPQHLVVYWASYMLRFLIIAMPLILMTTAALADTTPCRTNHRGQIVCKDTSGDQWTQRKDHRDRTIWVNQRTHQRIRERVNNNRGVDFIASGGTTVGRTTQRSGDRTRIEYSGGTLVCRPDPVRLVRCYKE